MWLAVVVLMLWLKEGGVTLTFLWWCAPVVNEQAFVDTTQHNFWIQSIFETCPIVSLAITPALRHVAETMYILDRLLHSNKARMQRQSLRKEQTLFTISPSKLPHPPSL
ncbi:hypothetical protein BD289DRAFT_79440 [Coniella lustricola]|uniref:Uncharacterized protein n=1 Tax=Coniella lustricola TaxID=2025994 RepID=A0A2T2ZZ28_9PEZI|nr:hypothetical protein BD289DRAFT_79440 [Coniella lustricola]